MQLIQFIKYFQNKIKLYKYQSSVINNEHLTYKSISNLSKDYLIGLFFDNLIKEYIIYLYDLNIKYWFKLNYKLPIKLNINTYCQIIVINDVIYII